MHKSISSLWILLSIALVGLVLVALSNAIFRGLRIDLTQDQVFTISDGTKAVLANLEQEVSLELFYSEKQTRESPSIRDYAQRIRQLLDEYVLASDGKLSLQVIDPAPFSEQEDKAAGYGLTAMPHVAGSQEVYLGLAASSASGGLEVIPFFQPSREALLEYDLSQAIYLASRQTPAKIALSSGLGVNGGFDILSQQPSAAWVSIAQLERLYEVENLGTDFTQVPADIDTLVLIHPANFSDATLYAIDQFVLRSGKLLLFIDPNAEMADPRTGAARASNLDKLLKQWGVEMIAGQVVGDAANAVSIRTQATGRQIPHLGISRLGPDNLSADNVITGQLETLHLSSAGALKQLAESGTEFQAMLTSSDQAGLIDAAQFLELEDHGNLFNAFNVSGEQYVFGARISGDATTAFPGGYTAPAVDDETENPDAAEETEADTLEAEQIPEHLEQAQQSINVIVVADTDMLSDRLWVQVSNFLGQRLAQPFADNGNFLINAVDTLAGSSDLMSIRGRGRYARPFTKVDALRRQAEASFREKENQLLQRLEDTETKLNELQQPVAEGESKIELSAEQQETLDRWQQEKLKIRKELREVRHQLDRDIESLGASLKLINIFLLPLLLTALLIGIRWYKQRASQAA